MKPFFLILSLIACLGAFSQILEPVKWKYEAKKIADKNYELHITATIDDGWHLYSHIQPQDAIAVPTTIKFSKNASVTCIGKIKEVGGLEKAKEPTLGITQNQYSEKVDFVQVIQLKANVKTKVSGSIEFQACTNEMCLPPKTIQFNVPIQ